MGYPLGPQGRDRLPAGSRSGEGVPATSNTGWVGVPLGLEPSPTIVVKRAFRLLSAFALTACATYSPHEA